MREPIAATNDFVVKFANVNGSGSASANELFARCVLRMGVPVASRNIFPSNIQGLPTWYEVRVSGEGWLGRRGGVDLMVAMNPQTWDRDIAEIDAGGYLFYDSSKPLTTQKTREDITLLGVPLTQLSNTLEGTIPRERQLLKNIIYLGALAAILGFEPKVQGQGQVDRAQHAGGRAGPQLRRQESGRQMPIESDALRQGRQSYFHRRQRCGRSWCRLWRRHSVRLVSHHAVHVARRSVHRALQETTRGP
jgi:Pyruvate/2-oxoacid:ferredoxin oxidoreductase gamma subunit